MTINVEDITLRRYTSSDIPTVIERHERLYWEEFSYPPDAFGKHVSNGLEQLVQMEDARLWIAEYQPPSNGGDVIPEKTWASSIAIVPIGEKTGRIRFLLVGSEFRTCGLGKRLIETALDYCRTEGYTMAALSTAGECVAAHRLYRRYGFEQVKVKPGTPWGKGSTDEWWETKL
jgi:GNAT superfamily N-acetyltransferase